VGWEAVRIGAIVGVFTGLMYFLFGSNFAHLYTDDAAVTAMAAGALKIIAVSQPFHVVHVYLHRWLERSRRYPLDFGYYHGRFLGHQGDSCLSFGNQTGYGPLRGMDWNGP